MQNQHSKELRRTCHPIGVNARNKAADEIDRLEGDRDHHQREHHAARSEVLRLKKEIDALQAKLNAARERAKYFNI